LVSIEEQNDIRQTYVSSLAKALDQSRKPAQGRQTGKPDKDHVVTNVGAIMQWQKDRNRYSLDTVETAVQRKTLNSIGERLTTVPEGFNIHNKLKRIIEAKRKSILDGASIDFSTAESLAFGSLLLEGTRIRLSGEDSGRGTFSQRHAVWWDTDSSVPTSYVPLNSLGDGNTRLSVYDSPLSEYSILGFEYGYSLSIPDELVLWEAQFGDFSNGAQVLIDNYLVSGEAKWNNASRLVLLLPHGYEGMGPEHSSAHLERYLLLCAEDNIQVCNLTTPAQYFHLLRRQMKQKASKPLIIMTPKSLLRHKSAVSPMDELATGSFQFVIDDPVARLKTSDVKTLCFCSGKLYYDLLKRKQETGAHDTAIVRIEQLYPFPGEQLRSIVQAYANTTRRCWAQEESQNRGAWLFFREQAAESLGATDFEYIGRERSASPATGSHKRHFQEQEAIVNALFTSAARTVSNKKTAKTGVATKK
jgi:2-oxoglutarate dehydrogenase E1 component